MVPSSPRFVAQNLRQHPWGMARETVIVAHMTEIKLHMLPLSIRIWCFYGADPERGYILYLLGDLLLSF